MILREAPFIFHSASRARSSQNAQDSAGAFGSSAHARRGTLGSGAHARRGTFRRGWKVGDVSSLRAVVGVRDLLRHPTRTCHNSNGFSETTRGKQQTKADRQKPTVTVTVTRTDKFSKYYPSVLRYRLATGGGRA